MAAASVAAGGTLGKFLRVFLKLFLNSVQKLLKQNLKLAQLKFKVYKYYFFWLL